MNVFKNPQTSELLPMTGRGRVTQPQREPELQQTSIGKPASQGTMWLQRNQARIHLSDITGTRDVETGPDDIAKEGVALLI